MGGAIARRLKREGFQISVWDRKKSKAEALDVGRVAGSPADAVRDAEVVISSVTGPQALVRQLFARVAARTPDLDISAIVDTYAKEAAR